MLRFCIALLGILGHALLLISLWEIFKGEPHFETMAIAFLVLIYGYALKFDNMGKE
jgi:hypothetical protein